MSSVCCFRLNLKIFSLIYQGTNQKLHQSKLLIKLDWAHRYRTFRTVQTSKDAELWKWPQNAFQFEYRTKFPDSLHLQKLQIRVVAVGVLFDSEVASACVDLRSLASQGVGSIALPCYTIGDKQPIDMTVSFTCSMIQWFPLARLHCGNLTVAVPESNVATCCTRRELVRQN